MKFASLILLCILSFAPFLVAQDSLRIENQLAESHITESIKNETPAPSPFIAPSEFTYAGQERITLMGTPPFRETSIKTTPFAVLMGTYAATITALHIYQVNTIWDSTTSFRIIEDGDYGLYVDKLGHVWGGYMNAYILSEFLMGSGLSHSDATHWGAAMSFAYQSYVEILDGFGSGWGFSPSDMYSNALGIGYFLGQHYVPFLQNFTPKANYIPPTWYGGKARDNSSSFIDDYSGYTFMLSANVNNLLPKEWDSYWPDWLNIGVGYTARNLTYRDGEKKYLIGLDINPAMILPDGGTEWNWFKQSLNYILLPLPMLEISPDGPPVFRLMYPFHFSIGSINF